MKYIILGAGEVGFQLAKQMILQGKDVILIEKDPAKAKYATNHLDCMVVNENGTSIESLKSIETEKAGTFIAVTDSDEVNLIACSLASSAFNVPRIIARVKSLEYNSRELQLNGFMGINYIVNPDIEAAKIITKTVRHGGYSKVFFFENSDFQMRKLHVSSDSPFCGRTVREIRSVFKIEYIITAISRNDELIIPGGETEIVVDDSIYVIARDRYMDQLMEKIVKDYSRITKVIIVGGGRIGQKVAESLISLKIGVAIIEKDYSRCKVLSNMFSEALILNIDVSTENIFDEEDFSSYDCIIAATENQELNILTAVYAKKKGIKRSISLVTNHNYLLMATGLGLNATVSPKISAVDSILKYTRKERVNSLHTIFDGTAEVFEIRVGNRDLAGMAIKDIEIPSGALLLTVSDGRSNSIANGDTVVKLNDIIIVVSRKENVDEVENFFSGQS